MREDQYGELEKQLHDKTLIHVMVRNRNNPHKLSRVFTLGLHYHRQQELSKEESLEKLHTFARIADSIIYQKTRQEAFSVAYRNRHVGMTQIEFSKWADPTTAQDYLRSVN